MFPMRPDVVDGRATTGGTFIPPPSIPLAFFLAAGIGLLGFGLSAWFAADRLTTAPNHPGAVSTAHTAVLAFLSMAVLGALHQFGPVTGRAAIRSNRAATWSLMGMATTAWLLPMGFAHGPEALIPVAGVVGLATVLVVAWNLSRPLMTGMGGLPALGLRVSVVYLVVTVSFGVTYAINREAGWFHLYPARVLAHAHLGLIGWLGLTYVSVAEKLWPMFLLSHRPRARSGHIAVIGVGIGVAPLAIGMAWDLPQLAWLGGSLVLLGLASHVLSLVSHLQHRRRRLDLLQAFLVAGAGFLVVGMVAGVSAALPPLGVIDRTRVVGVEVAALVAWLGLAILGHVHKIVPFIRYSTLRSLGAGSGVSGRPLVFTDLYRETPARVSLLTSVTGFGFLVLGMLIRSAGLVTAGGGVIALTACIVTFNLAVLPRRLSARRPEPVDPTAAAFSTRGPIEGDAP